MSPIRLSDLGTWTTDGEGFTWTSFEYTYTRPTAPPRSVQVNYYDTLEVPRGASLEECRTAWRRLAKRHHPDHGGDAELFKLCSTAWDAILKHYEKTI